ncbi:hypothetical protein [[Clostridium] innocuum]|uniref:hypothetical protein n=1 Tax=Clostridium innocuum TaxID=1522 RepID=UPI0011BD4FD8|nr:hypothetical protein [[Clostridium] innocuum]MCC2843808.1 hypothetical protein [[Clostridium] innocuum]MCC2848011.1 hypothetical protein [[Clostridium] innocuum]MCC2852146.1 hypothetical protein [[Clostridium] innocuum]
MYLFHKERHIETENTVYHPAEIFPSHKEDVVLDMQRAFGAPETILQALLVSPLPEAVQKIPNISVHTPDYFLSY